MATPKLPAAQITQLRKLADDYVEGHEQGGYAPGAVAMRRGYTDRFIDYLEGRYDPAADKGKRIAP